MKKLLLLIVSLFVFSSFHLKDHIVIPVNNEVLTLIFAGDVMGHAPQFKAAFNSFTNEFNYDACFQGVREYVQSADIAVVNLEVPLAGPPYSGYPRFSSPDALLDGLRNAGYDLILTANNHILDRGKSGLERTLHTISERNLLFTGSYIDKNQRDSIYPLIVDVKGVRLAFLNCSYGTNDIIPTSPNYVNYLDTIEVLKDIRMAEAKNADIIIMAVHWGNEYELQSSPMQKEFARFFAKNGVHLVIGSHPHVVQDAEMLLRNDSLKVPVYYSLGNSVSNQRKPNTDGGVMVKVEIGLNSKLILNTKYLPVYVHRGVLDAAYQYHLIPTTDFVNKTEFYRINKSDSTALMNFDKETRSRLSNMLILK